MATTNGRTIRSSALPLALACPASQTPPQTLLADDTPEARLGSAVHEVLAHMVRGADGAAFTLAIEQAAAGWRVEVEEVTRLAWAGRRAWDTLRDHFPNPDVERFYRATAGGLALTGHLDVSALVGDEFRVLDWKTGFVDEDHEPQVRSYAWLGLERRALADRSLAIVVRLREMTRDVYRWTRAELDEWVAGVDRDTAEAGRYRPGRHCQYCPRRRECGSRLHFVSQS